MPTPHDIAKDHKKKFIREMRIRAESVEANDERTVEFIASTETPVELYWGETEILLHGEENVDLSYLDKRKSPVLLDHWRSKVIGVIEDARIENKQLIVSCRFSKGPQGDEIYTDIVDGIRSNASIGYFVEEWNVNQEDKNTPIWTAIRWTPREMSIVAFPADDNAGVKRNQQFIENALREAGRTDFFIRSDWDAELTREEPIVPTETTEELEERTEGEPEGGEPEGGAPASPTGTREEPTTTVETEYDKEAQQIFQLTRDMELPNTRALQAIREKKRYADYLNEIAEEMGVSDNGDGTATPPAEGSFEGVDVEPKDAAEFSIVRALYGELGEADAGFEREIMNDEKERREKAGLPTRGLAIPMSILGSVGSVHQRLMAMANPPQRMSQRATLIAGTDNVGGALVAEELRTDEFIDYLWAESAILPYATMMPNLMGDVAIPKQLTRVTASWVGETQAAGESNPTFGLVRLTPKDMRVKVPYSRRLSLQSGLSIEPLLRMIIMSSFANFLDQQLIYGTGTDTTIKGINKIANVNDATKQLVNYPKAGLDYASCLNAISAIGKQDALTSSLAWALSWGFWKEAMATPRLTGADTAILNSTMMNMMMPGRCEIAGFPAMPTSQVADAAVKSGTNDTNANEAYAGDWSKVFLGFWGGLDIELDDKTTLDQGVFNLVAFWTVDAEHAHDESFAKLTRTA